jgi:mRNA interferase HicA
MSLKPRRVSNYSSIGKEWPRGSARRSSRNTFVDLDPRDIYIVFMNSSQAKRFLAKRGATFSAGKGGHLIVTLNGRRSVLPQHGGSKEIGKGLWQAILRQLDIKE